MTFEQTTRARLALPFLKSGGGAGKTKTRARRLLRYNDVFDLSLICLQLHLIY